MSNSCKARGAVTVVAFEGTSIQRPLNGFCMLHSVLQRCSSLPDSQYKFLSAWMSYYFESIVCSYKTAFVLSIHFVNFYIICSGLILVNKYFIETNNLVFTRQKNVQIRYKTWEIVPSRLVTFPLRFARFIF